jgi:hypothetical protein
LGSLSHSGKLMYQLGSFGFICSCLWSEKIMKWNRVSMNSCCELRREFDDVKYDARDLSSWNLISQWWLWRNGMNEITDILSDWEEEVRFSHKHGLDFEMNEKGWSEISDEEVDQINSNGERIHVGFLMINMKMEGMFIAEVSLVSLSVDKCRSNRVGMHWWMSESTLGFPI